MNVSITPKLERFVLEKVASGRYRSASEVVRAALRLLEQHQPPAAIHRTRPVAERPEARNGR